MFEGVVSTSQMCQNFFARASFGQVRCARTFFIGPRLDKSDGPELFCSGLVGDKSDAQEIIFCLGLVRSKNKNKQKLLT